MKILFVVCVSLIILSNCGAKVAHGELLVIENNTDLFCVNNSVPCENKHLKLFDRIFPINNEVSNGKILVRTSDGVKGGVEVSKTNYIPKEWLAYNELEDVVFSFAPGIKFRLFKDTVRPTKIFVDSKLMRLYEHKMFSDKYFIVIRGLIHNYEEHIQEELKRYKEKNDLFNLQFNCNRFKYNTTEGLFSHGKDMESGNDVYNIILKGENDFIIQMGIVLNKKNYNNEDRIIAKKMLFSLKVKK